MGQQRRGALDVAFDDPTLSDEDNFMFAPGSLQPPDAIHTQDTREFTWRGLFAHLGPAFLVSIGYLDPGNWATDIEGGSKFGYKLLWVLVLSNAMALLLQVLAARMGIVTRCHLAELCRDEYPRLANLILWLMAELAIIATDLTEVLGTAIGINLLFKIPLMPAVIITVADTFLLLSAQHRGMRRIEQVIFCFLAIISLCFTVELFMSNPDVNQIAAGLFVPQIDSSSLYVATGIVGATVMPHNFYLHSALVIERVPDRRPTTIRAECRYNLIDTAVALNAALFINCAILIIAAANFWTRGVQVTTLAKAYELLQNTGVKVWNIQLAPFLFGIALIASGQSSTLCGTLAGQYVMEGFLDYRAPPLIRRLVTRVIAIMPALTVISILGDHGTYQLLIFCQVVLALQLPFAIVPMIRFTSSKRRMQDFQNSRLVTILAWLATAIVISLNIAYAFHIFAQWANSDRKLIRFLTISVAGPLFIVIMGFLAWIAVRSEKGGSGLVYRIENDIEGQSDDGFDLDSLGSPVARSPVGQSPTPLLHTSASSPHPLSPIHHSNSSSQVRTSLLQDDTNQAERERFSLRRPSSPPASATKLNSNKLN